jgi:hypothetical protein
MTYQELAMAVQDAKNTLEKADSCTGQLARMMAGRLRESNASAYTLAKLKRELRDFNIHTGKWKE